MSQTLQEVFSVPYVMETISLIIILAARVGNTRPRFMVLGSGPCQRQGQGICELQEYPQKFHQEQKYLRIHN